MTRLAERFFRLPIATSFSVVLASIALFLLESRLGVTGHIPREMLHSSVQVALSIVIFVVISRSNWFKKTDIISFGKPLVGRMWLAAVPITMIGAINLSSARWADMAVDGPRLAAWVFNNVSTGLFEELLLRGFCFYLLYTAWKSKKNALVKAALAQAVIFGLAHLVNLRIAPNVDVFAQVIYATLLGIGFAGIVAYTKSLWPAIVAHSFINAMGDLNNFFIDGYEQAPGSIGGYALAIVIISLVATLPGLVMLRIAESRSH